MIIKKTPSNRKQRLVTTQRTHAGRLKTASFPVVLGDLGRDVICQTSRENITRLARTGRRTRLEGRLTSFRPSGLHSHACFSSAKTTGKWKKKKNENYQTTFPKIFGTWLESNFVFMFMFIDSSESLKGKQWIKTVFCKQQPT